MIPNKFSRVCSDRFIDGAPTDDHPNLELKFGYNAKVVKRRKVPSVLKSLPQIKKCSIIRLFQHQWITEALTTINRNVRVRVWQEMEYRFNVCRVTNGSRNWCQ